jgi:hypothetical protein
MNDQLFPLYLSYILACSGPIEINVTPNKPDTTESSFNWEGAPVIRNAVFYARRISDYVRGRCAAILSPFLYLFLIETVAEIRASCV